jgi:hypothetical protein
MRHSVLTSQILFAATWVTLAWTGDAVAGQVINVGDRIAVPASAFSNDLDSDLLSERKISPFSRTQVLTGTVKALESGVLILQVGKSDVSVPAREVERAYLWSQGDYGFPIGALGLAFGAIVGGVIGHSKEPPPDCAWVCPTKGHYAAAGAVVGGLIGCSLGFMIGRTQPRDNWTEVSLAPLRANLILDEHGSVGLVCFASF